MIILEKYRLLEKFIGLSPDGRIENIISQTIFVHTLISFNLMELIFIIVNSQYGFEKAATALSPICGVIPAMADYIFLLFNRKQYYSLLREMQDIVNDSM